MKAQPMKAHQLHSLWITILSSFLTGYYCFLASIKGLFGKVSRSWVDSIVQLWSTQLLDLVRADCKVINPHHVEPTPGKATIVMCNHSSLFDIPISFKAFPHHSMRMLAKKELSTMPFMGKGMVAAEFPFIDRKNRHQAIQDLVQAKKLMESGIIMWISPEGTRSKNGKLAAFKKGGFITAIESNATIIPIGIRGAFDILPAKTRRFNIHQKVEIHIGEPVDASQYRIDNKDELIDRVHREMKILVGECD
jgi:1-acyl-sn-glycerol-3-phosphate acyltransferase